MKHLEDNFGRKFPYIRMSITEVCNFKCGYCLPNGYQVDKSDNRKFLNIDEIRRLAKGFSELGVQKIRLTGGEPTVRKDFYEIVKILNEKIRPAVARDGGDIKFKEFKDGVVKVQLQGSCSGCPSSTMTLKQGVQNLLCHYLPEVKKVEAI